MKFIHYCLFSVFLLSIIGCKKTEEVTIPGNIAPPDPTIETVVKENYVHKLYISLLGRKATDQEFEESYSVINNGNLSTESRIEVIADIQSKPGYFNNEYTLMRSNLLNALDTAEVTLFIAIIDNEIMNSNDEEYTNALILERDRLIPLSTLLNDLESGLIEFPEAHRRCVNNFFYDEINMGTENFVVSIYQNFFQRYPTTEELEGASVMVDGLSSIAFYEVGDSKDDFLNIFIASDDYYEGQVRNLYNRYLFRDASSEESAYLSGTYQVNNDYQSIQQYILSSDEYVGL